MDVTLIANGRDFSQRLSTYAVTEEIAYRKVITTLDGVEHPVKQAPRPMVTFSLLPSTDDECERDYAALSSLVFDVTFTRNGKDVTSKMRVVSNLESAFLLKSVDGKRRYSGSQIQLRRL